VTAEATFAGTLPAIQRTADHWYRWTDPVTGEKFNMPGVTGLLNTLWKGHALDAWKDKTLAECAVGLYRSGTMDELTDAMAVAAIREAVKEPRMVAANLGSSIHQLAELYHKSSYLPGTVSLADKYVSAYIAWWEASGWRLRLSEAIVINPSHNYGGTFDLLAYDEDGKTVLADIKTGGVWREAILQLAAYGLCPLVSPMGSDKVYPMPVPDRYVVLDVKPEGVRPIEVNIGQADLMAWADVLDLYKWQQSVKGKL
jgi:hypothetical protein